MGYDQLAATWYRTAAEHLTTYYGQLAATALGEPKLERALDEPTPSAAESEAFDKPELVRGLRQLSESDATEYMRPFMLRLSQLAQAPPEQALVADLALQSDPP